MTLAQAKAAVRKLHAEFDKAILAGEYGRAHTLSTELSDRISDLEALESEGSAGRVG